MERIGSPIILNLTSRVLLPMKPEFEREYFRLAAVWLHCRLLLIQANSGKDRMWHFLGEMDYGTEMAIMIEEERRNLSRLAGADLD